MRILKLLIPVVLCTAGVAVAAPAADAAVVLNEVNCEGTDWIELVNTSATDADVTGWLLTDAALDATEASHRFTLPTTTIPGNGSVSFEKGASGFAFGIKCGDDTIRLADATGGPVDDQTIPALTDPADTWGRYPNGTGPWAQTTSSRGSPNSPSSSTGGGDTDAAAWLFDPHAVVQINLQLPQESIDALGTTPDAYQDGTFSLSTTGGTYGPFPVGVRLKGHYGSFRPLSEKAGFKIKFSPRFLGLKKLTLNNMVQDPSMIHETLAYKTFHAAGVPAPRTGYAFVRVNGADYGVYLDLETLDDVALPRLFDSTKHLYEGSYGSDTTPGDEPRFEVDEGDDSDVSDLTALIAAVNGTTGDWSDRVDAVADLSEMTKEWAVEQYIGHWDGYAGSEADPLPNNFYLHSNAAGRFSMVPWGTDQTWEDRLPFGSDAGEMFDRCFADASCNAMYRQALRDVRALVAGLDLDSEAQTLATELAPWQAMDHRQEFDAQDTADGVQGVRDFLAARSDEAAAWLDPPPDPPDDDDPVLPAKPTKETVKASTVTAPPAGTIRLGNTKRTSRAVSLRIRVSGAGKLRLRGTARWAGATHTACTAKAAPARAGVVTLRCPLRSGARRALHSRRLRLTLKTLFVPAQGSAARASRKLTLSRAASPRA